MEAGQEDVFVARPRSMRLFTDEEEAETAKEERRQKEGRPAQRLFDRDACTRQLTTIEFTGKTAPWQDKCSAT